jgi:cell division protein FtsN
MNENKQGGEKKVGPIVATLIIVLILIIAALYLFASKVNQPAIPTDASVTTGNAAPASAQDIQSLQNDLNSSTNGLDKQNF